MSAATDVPEWLKDARVIHLQPSDVIIVETDTDVVPLHAREHVLATLRKAGVHNDVIVVAGARLGVVRPASEGAA